MKLPRKLRIVLLAIVSLFVVWLIYYSSISVVYGVKLRNLRAQVNAEGSSLDPVELRSELAGKPLSASQNAAYLYRAAGNLMEMRKGPEVPEVNSYDAFLKAKSGARAKIVSEKRPSLETWLRDSAIPLRLLHDAAKFDHARFDIDYSEGKEIKLPHVAQLFDGARLLMLEAWLAAEQGDSHKALQATWAALRLRRATEDEPFVLSEALGVWTDAIAATTLQDTIPLIQPQEMDLLLILRELQSRKANNFRLVAEALRASRAAEMESARKNGLLYVMSEGYPQKYLPGILESTLVGILNGSLPDETFSIAYMNRFVKAASELESMTVADMQRFDGEESQEASTLAHSFGGRYFHESLRQFLPFSPTARPFKRDFARRDVTVCGIAAELYRLDHGDYPTSLNALVPNYLATLPKDTFSGKALLFKSLPSGVLIYSVGPNGRDDGGVGDQTWDESERIAPQGLLSAADDIVWRVERTAAATDTP